MFVLVVGLIGVGLLAGTYLAALLLARGKAGWLCIEHRTEHHHTVHHVLVDGRHAAPQAAVGVLSRPVRQLPVLRQR
jgi:hypothetical protein